MYNTIIPMILYLKKLLISTLVVFLIVGCSSKIEEKQSVSESKTHPPMSAVPQKTLGHSSVIGKVLFSGTPPPPVRSSVKSFSECAIHHKGKVYTDDILIKNGKLQNVFVYVKQGLENQSFSVPSESVMLDQVGCIYTPHVLGIQTGQELIIKNSDVALHNVHSNSSNQKSFNIGMPVQGMKIKKTFLSPEIMISVTCDIHPWMKAYIGVLPHSFFDATDENGAFSISNLGPGDYEIEAWHEKFGVKTQKIHLEDRETKEITFTFTE